MLIDFDGTVTQNDSVDAILEAFALPEWRTVEASWIAGTIGSRECMRQQAGLIRAWPHELNAFIDNIAIDPAFRKLLQTCADENAAYAIVSDGYDVTIRRVLGRLGVDCPVVCGRLEHVREDNWRFSAPYSDPECRSGAGTCKCMEAMGGNSILIGDGRSDFCVAGTASFVFAKGALAQHCRDSGIPHLEFHTLHDILTPLRATLRRMTANTYQKVA